jgi:ubiquitin-like modifier-activating enzyme ATG7
MNNKLHMGLSFDRCIACSSRIVERYIADRNNLLVQAFNNPTSLEDVTGITELKAECDLSDFEWDSEEDEEENDGDDN